MKTSALLALAAASRLALCHTTVHAIFVNDVDQGAGNSASGYIRSPPNNNPITDVQSSAMTCNVNNAATAKTIDVKGGDKITFEWHHDSRTASDDIIAGSHKGPILTYIAPTKSNGAGNVWVKLAEEGFSNGKWAVDNLIANKGKHSITLPDLAAGEYLLRPEIIALHEGNRVGGAQFYLECVQIRVTSSGSKTLSAGVALPGAYKSTDPGVLFNLYSSFTSYPIPGPAVWNGASGAVAAPVTPSVPAITKAPASTPTPTPVHTTLVTAVRPTTPAAQPSTPAAGAANAVAKWGQCGGINYTGSTTCVSGSSCKS
ncbi:hypothetical protein GQ43DRAFT_205631 [Delitschia confertaspora ATCC 74209]|uniref:AA9 family lytic polysaccharide monooxygenase n=1 Tax=Delitschia confertaspora ATCC 74209 TaxID=1513339 RepID=A0A9P4JVD5_9PLEO|nr:hypothetical protein GQ43DRAFT_205631 [Delitschia confertaspora ATCC 74209]